MFPSGNTAKIIPSKLSNVTEREPMNFTPATDYKSLLVQARALYSLIKNNEDILQHYKSKDYKLAQIRLDGLESSLDSEREANSILTEENEKLLNFVKFIANDYIELSHEKIAVQRDDYVRMAREKLNEHYNNLTTK